jgi:hypothetical protein
MGRSRLRRHRRTIVDEDGVVRRVFAFERTFDGDLVKPGDQLR